MLAAFTENFTQGFSSLPQETIAAAGQWWATIQAHALENPPTTAVLIAAVAVVCLAGRRVSLFLAAVLLGVLLLMLLALQPAVSHGLTLGLSVAAMTALAAGLMQHRVSLRRARRTIESLTIEHAALCSRLEREILWRNAAKQNGHAPAAFSQSASAAPDEHVLNSA